MFELMWKEKVELSRVSKEITVLVYSVVLFKILHMLVLFLLCQVS